MPPPQLQALGELPSLPRWICSLAADPPSESLTQRQKVLSSLILDQGSHDSKKREFFLSRKSDFKRKPNFNSMKSNNLEKSQNQNNPFTENLKIKQVQSESLATSFRSACSKSKFDVERFPLESGYASLGFQKEKTSPALQTSVFTKENQPRIAEAKQ